MVFGDFGRDWEVLRRLAYSAVRKYTVTEHLSTMVADVVDEAVLEMIETQGHQAFDIHEYIYLIVYNVLAQSAYGTK